VGPLVIIIIIITMKVLLILRGERNVTTVTLLIRFKGLKRKSHFLSLVFCVYFLSLSLFLFVNIKKKLCFCTILHHFFIFSNSPIFFFFFRMFKECPHPDEKQRLQLSRELALAPRQIKFWFQNRRTQMKVLF